MLAATVIVIRSIAAAISETPLFPITSDPTPTMINP
jgi:hypothetical protein